MKKILLSIAAVLLFNLLVFAQEEEQEKVKDKPVTEQFGSGWLIDNQTSFIPSTKTLEFVIQHRFGDMSNGLSDIWGIYSPGANIRLGLSYVVIDKLQLGYGLTMKNMTSDFSAKYNILEQTRKNTIPLFLTFYGNIGVDGRNKDAFGENYKGSHRVSYFAELIVGRKFNDWLSFEARGNWTHFNIMQPGYDHDRIGIGFDGRIKFSPQSSLFLQYNIPLKIASISENKNADNTWEDLKFPYDNMGIGYEVNTGAHSIQIYVVSSKGILPQYSYIENPYEWTKGNTGLMFGFTMTRLWSY